MFIWELLRKAGHHTTHIYRNASRNEFFYRMFSNDRNNNNKRLDISASLVRRLLAKQFPRWDNLPVQPMKKNGWDNITFRLGNDMLVRLPSAKQYAAQVAK